MRKFLVAISAMIIAFGGILTSCTSDDEFETEQGEKEAKAIELRTQILAMAEEYGLNVEVGDTRSMVDDKDALSKVEKIFENACKVKGNYKLSSSRNGNVVSVKQNGKFRVRPKILTRSTEKYDFEDYKDGLLTVSCSLEYSENPETGELSVISVDASIDDPTTYDYDCIDDVSGLVYDNVIIIDGEVRAEYFLDNDRLEITEEPYLIIKYEADGYFDGTNGEITWD